MDDDEGSGNIREVSSSPAVTTLGVGGSSGSSDGTSGGCLSPVVKVTIACALFSFFSSGIVQFGLMTCTLTTVQEEFSLSYSAIAAAIVSFQVTQVLASPFIPHIEQKWPRIPAEMLCAIGITMSILGTLFYGLAQHLAMLFIGQLISGVGSGSVYIMMASMISRLVDDPAVISLRLGQGFAATPLGIVVGAVSCTAAVEHWRWLYVIFGCCLAIPAVVFFLIANSYRKHDPRHKIPAPPTYGELRRHIFKYPSTTLAFGGITSVAFLVASFAGFLVPYFEEHLGQSKETASLLMGATVPSVCIGSVVGGKLAHYHGWTHRRLFLFTTSNCVIAFALCLVFLPADITIVAVVVVILVLAEFVLFLQAGPAIALVAQMLPRHCITHGQSVVNMVSRACGGIIGPLVTAVILDSGAGYNVALFAMSWALVLATIFFGLGWYFCPTEVEIEHAVGHQQPLPLQAGSPTENPPSRRSSTQVVVVPAGEGEEMSGSPSEYMYSPAQPLQPVEESTATRSNEPFSSA